MYGNRATGLGKKGIAGFGYLEDGLHPIMPGEHRFPAVGPTVMVITIGSLGGVLLIF